MERKVIKLEKQWLPLLLATRPKTLAATLGPVVSGTALAYSLTGRIDGFILLITLFSALCVQIGTNLVNDALDFKKGADTKERLGPKRLTATGVVPMEQVLAAGLAFFATALVVGIPLMIQGGWPIVLLLLLSCVMGYLYTGGPYPLAYHGLGELANILFFGLALTAASAYLQAHTFNPRFLVIGLQMGFLSTAILAINNLRDIAEDTKSNKVTLAVRFGKFFARIEITAMLFLAFSLNLFWVFDHHLFAASLPLLTLPLAAGIILNIWKYDPGPRHNKLLGMAGLQQLLFGILFAVGMLLS